MNPPLHHWRFYIINIISAGNKRIKGIILNFGRFIQPDLHLQATRDFSLLASNDTIRALPTAYVLWLTPLFGWKLLRNAWCSGSDLLRDSSPEGQCRVWRLSISWLGSCYRQDETSIFVRNDFEEIVMR